MAIVGFSGYSHHGLMWGYERDTSFLQNIKNT